VVGVCRLQPCRYNTNSSGTPLGTCADAIPSGSVQDYNNGFGLGTLDNGNVASMTATGTQNFSRSFTYDALNRLQAMSAPGDTCSGLNWTYDAWVTASLSPTPVAPAIPFPRRPTLRISSSIACTTTTSMTPPAGGTSLKQ
jgi:hypothetical protein